MELNDLNLSLLSPGAFLNAEIAGSKGDILRFIASYRSGSSRSVYQLRFDFEIIEWPNTTTSRDLLNGFKDILDECIFPLQTNSTVWKKVTMSLIGYKHFHISIPLIGWNGKLDSIPNKKAFFIDLVPIKKKYGTSSKQHKLTLHGVSNILVNYSNLWQIYAEKEEENVKIEKLNSILSKIEMKSQVSGKEVLVIMETLAKLQQTCVYEFELGSTGVLVRFVRIAKVTEAKVNPQVKRAKKTISKKRGQRIPSDKLIRFHYAIAGGF